MHPDPSLPYMYIYTYIVIITNVYTDTDTDTHTHAVYNIYIYTPYCRLFSDIFIYLHNFPSKFTIISCLPTLGRPNLLKTVLRHVQVLQKWKETSSTVPQVVQTLGSTQDISSFFTTHFDSKVRNAFSSFQCISASSSIQ